MLPFPHVLFSPLVGEGAWVEVMGSALQGRLVLRVFSFMFSHWERGVSCMVATVKLGGE